MVATDDTFDYKDVRALLMVALEMQATRESVWRTTQQEALRLLRANADFSNPASGQAWSAGRLLGAYIYAYRRVVVEQEKGQGKGQVEAERRRQEGMGELLVLEAYEAAAREAMEKGSEENRKRGEEFLEAINRYNSVLPAGEKIVDGYGQMIDVRQVGGAQEEHLERLINGQIPVGVREEKKEEVEGAASRVSREIKGGLSDMRAAMSDAIEKP
jgi:hypothetical protein